MSSVGSPADATRQRLLPPEVAVPLFCEAVRLAADAGVSLRPRLLRIGDDGEVRLDRHDAASAAEDRPGYVAPEVVAGLATAEDPKALVYAAGAFGFELLTGSPMPDGQLPSDKPIGAVLAKALAPAHQRLASLAQLALELEKVHPAKAKALRDLHLALGARNPAAATAVPQNGPEPKAPPAPRQGRPADAPLAAAQAQISRLQIALAQAQGREEQLKATILALQKRTQVLTHLASAAASGPAEHHPAETHEAGIAPGRRWPLLAAAAVSVVAVIVAAVALRAAAVRERSPEAAAEVPVVLSSAPRKRVTEGTPAERPAPARPAAASHPARAAAQPPRTARSEVDRGERALAAGKTDEALAAFQAAQSLDARLPDAAKGLAAAYMQRGDPRSARPHYERYLELAPAAPDADRIRRLLAQFRVGGSR